MNWSFVRFVLLAFGFHNRFIQWIMTCCTTLSMDILLNGAAFQNFQRARGLRQGDHLSPYLFILCMEVLSRLINHKVEEGAINGFLLARGVSPIHHLFFADDIFLFGKATISEANHFRDCLDTFCSWSGQTFNSHKSNIFFTTKSAISPSLWTNLTVSWLDGNLNSYLKIDAKIKHFWWGTKDENSIPLCLWVWESLCIPKSFGGLGLQCSTEMNRALLAKWCWNLLSGYTSWCLSLLRGKYLRDSSFMCVVAKPTNSLFWKSILAVKPLILKGACIHLGRGDRVDLWLHPWVPKHPTFRP
ncbi:hypothetical protein UlMin_038032 [Ulmus minor]